MPVPSANFVAEKNKEVNGPIFLFRINVYDDPDVTGQDDLYYAKWDTDIDFFKDVDTPQTYTRIPAELEMIKEDGSGDVGGIKVTLGNASREVQAICELNDGLRNRKVTIRQVFLDQLADSDAYVQDVFYIDSVVTTHTSAEFTLIPKLDIMNIFLPLRRYSRNHCHAVYKGRGCWPASGSGGAFEEPGGWLDDGSPLMPDNAGSPIVVFGEVANFSEALARLTQGTGGQALNLQGLTKANGTLYVYIMCSVPARLTADSHIRLTSAADPSTPANEWKYTDLTGLGITGSWVEISFALSDFATVNGELDVTNLRHVIIDNTAAGINTARMSFHSPRIVWAGAADVCDKTLTNCQRHNNVARFIGFPTVPSRMRSRA